MNFKAINKNGFKMDDKNNPYDNVSYVDTGVPVMNAILSDGDMFKGVYEGRRYTFGGESSTAKSLFVMYLTKKYIEEQEKKGNNTTCIFWETEGATLSQMAETVGLPKEKIFISPVTTVEDFRTQAINALLEIEKEQEKDKNKRFIFVLDSLGMLGTIKETEDAISNKNKADMTRAKIIRSIFRLITLRLFQTKTTLFTINHIYDSNDVFSGPVISGGKGIIYASDYIFMLTKSKEKDGTNRIGSVITMKLLKSRFQPEENKVKIILLNESGILPHSQLFEIGKECGIFEGSTKYKVHTDPINNPNNVLFDGKQISRKWIMKNPKQVFIPEIMQIIRDYLYKELSWNSNTNSIISTDNAIDILTEEENIVEED